jgi:ATP-dependent Clp protease ATP-binding subunit ClpC
MTGPLAASCLARLSITRERVEQRVVELIGRGDNAPTTSLGITPRTKRLFEHARRDARRLGRRCPQPEHLLLAIWSVRDGVGRDILAGFGASEEQARETLAELLSGQAPELAERMRRRPRRRLARH